MLTTVQTLPAWFVAVMTGYGGRLEEAYRRVLGETMFAQVAAARETLLDERSFMSPAQCQRPPDMTQNGIFIAANVDEMTLFDNGAALIEGAVLAPGFCLSDEPPNHKQYHDWVDPHLGEVVFLSSEFALFAIQQVPTAILDEFIPRLTGYRGSAINSKDDVGRAQFGLTGSREEKIRALDLTALEYALHQMHRIGIGELNKAVFRELDLTVPKRYYPRVRQRVYTMRVTTLEHSLVLMDGDAMEGATLAERLDAMANWTTRCMVTPGSYQENFAHSLGNTHFERCLIGDLMGL